MVTLDELRKRKLELKKEVITNPSRHDAIKLQVRALNHAEQIILQKNPQTTFISQPDNRAGVSS